MIKALAFAGLIACCGVAHAAPPMPAVNSDSACSASGQMLIYNGTLWVCSNPTMPITTVGLLGTCGTAQKGQQLLVTDALAPTFLAIVVGGGAVVAGALCNGTNWIVR